MNIDLKPTKVWPTSDGKTFTDRKDAVAHERSLIQIKQLVAAKLPTNKLSTIDTDTGDSILVLHASDIPDFIAANAAAIFAALTVKEARAPRAPKVTSAA